MNCQAVQQQLSSRLDGELDAVLQGEVDAHLASCPTCREEAEALQAWDASARRELDVDRELVKRIEVGVMRQIAAGERGEVGRAWPTPPVRWFGLAMAAAAGYLICFLTVKQPSPLPAPGPIAPPRAEVPFALLRHATGSLQVEQPTVGFVPSSDPVLRVGTRLRTGASKGELITPSGVRIRLDSDTEVDMTRPDHLQLEAGRLWCEVPPKKKVSIASGDATISLEGARCAVVAGSGGAEVLSLEGVVKVQGETWEGQVDQGQQMRITPQGLESVQPELHPMIATNWMHELMLSRQGQDEELKGRVEQLWAALGYSKVQLLYEQELRALGPSCVHPLASFLQSDAPEHRSPYRRRLAAKILADVGDFRAVPLFIALLADRDGEVRSHMARGLIRITGQQFGGPPDGWKTAKEESRATWIGQWEAWMQRTRRFPEKAGGADKRI